MSSQFESANAALTDAMAQSGFGPLDAHGGVPASSLPRQVAESLMASRREQESSGGLPEPLQAVFSLNLHPRALARDPIVIRTIIYDWPLPEGGWERGVSFDWQSGGCQSDETFPSPQAALRDALAAPGG